MSTEQTHTHTESTRSSEQSPEAFARAAVAERARTNAALEEALKKIDGRLEEQSALAGEIGDQVKELRKSVDFLEQFNTPKTEAELKAMNVVSRSVHWLDRKLSSAAPYLRVGAAVAGAGGAIYGGVKAYKHFTAPKTQEGSPSPLTSAS